MIGFFELTSQYSNAVLVAILPYVSNVAKSLELPVVQPVSTNHVTWFKCDTRTNHFGGWLKLTNGFQFWFDHGHVRSFESAHCYFNLQDPDEIPRFFGKLNCTKVEAVQLARDTLKKLGYSAREVLEQEPLITMPPKLEGKIVPHYRLTWRKTWPDGYSNTVAQVEINGELKRIEYYSVGGTNFWRDNPKIAITPSLASRKTNANLTGGIRLEPVSAERRAEILQKVLPEISAYAIKLNLPVPPIITTNHLRDIECGLLKGDPNVQVILTNGYRFNYRDRYVVAFYAPDCFFTYDWQREGKTSHSFYAPLPTSEERLIELARSHLKKTGFFKNTRFLDQKPKSPGGPNLKDKVGVPRFMYLWLLPTKIPENELKDVPTVERPGAFVEVDSTTYSVKSIYISQIQ